MGCGNSPDVNDQGHTPQFLESSVVKITPCNVTGGDGKGKIRLA